MLLALSLLALALPCQEHVQDFSADSCSATAVPCYAV